MLEIRQANAADVNRMAEIETLCFPATEAASPAAFQQRFAVFPECFVVLESDGQVIGFINGCVCNDQRITDRLYEDVQSHITDGDYQTVFGIAVLPEFQRRGYALMLLEHFIKMSRSRGRKGVILTCKDALIPLYEKGGFKLLGVSDSVHGGVKWNDMALLF